MLDLEPIKNELAGAGHPEWFVGLDHQCGDDWLAVFDADPDAFDSTSSADVALVCGGIHPDKASRAAFIAAAPLRVAALIAEVERLRTALQHYADINWLPDSDERGAVARQAVEQRLLELQAKIDLLTRERDNLHQALSQVLGLRPFGLVGEAQVILRQALPAQEKEGPSHG